MHSCYLSFICPSCEHEIMSNRCFANVEKDGTPVVSLDMFDSIEKKCPHCKAIVTVGDTSSICEYRFEREEYEEEEEEENFQKRGVQAWILAS